jgi:cyanate permease
MRDVPLIATWSVGLAAWEVAAKATHRPTVTDCSHRWPWSLFVWAWLAALTYHFIVNAHDR